MSKNLDAVREALREILDPPPKTLTRAAFDALDPSEQMRFCKGGGKLTEPPKPPRRMVPPSTPYQMTRADFLQAEKADKLNARRP